MLSAQQGWPYLGMRRKYSWQHLGGEAGAGSTRLICGTTGLFAANSFSFLLCGWLVRFPWICMEEELTSCWPGTYHRYSSGVVGFWMAFVVPLWVLLEIIVGIPTSWSPYPAMSALALIGQDCKILRNSSRYVPDREYLKSCQSVLIS